MKRLYRGLFLLVLALCVSNANTPLTANAEETHSVDPLFTDSEIEIGAWGSVSTPVTDPSSLFGAGRLTMLANHDTAAQQLSVIIEDGEGGLVVIDGGWTDNAEYLFNQIKQKGGHVKAWLLTHPDPDHVGAIAEVIYRHRDELTIDGIYYSLAEDEWYQQKDPGIVGMVSYLRGALSLMPEAVLHKNLQAGEIIHAGRAQIQVLNKSYLLEQNPINNSSVTYLISLNGTNVVTLGDMGEEAGELLRRDCNLGALDCDIVTMAHHGQEGVGYEVYKDLKPEICLWPTPQWLWDNDNGGGPNSGPWKTMATRRWMAELGVKKHYCVKDGDQIIE